MTRFTSIFLLSVSFNFVLLGCRHTPPSNMAEANSPSAFHTGDTVRRVDPRLLEETDQPASSLAEEHAKAHHRTTSFAVRYLVFQRSRVLAHGGYSARFGTTAKSTEGVSYYFDEQGASLRTERRFTPY